MARTKPSSSQKNTLLKRSISAEQVLTAESSKTAEKGFQKQSVATKAASKGAEPCYSVRHRREIPTHEKARAGRKRGRKRKPGRKPAKRRGGWPPTKHLSHDDYRLAVHRAHLVEKAGYRFTVFATVRPPRGLSDSEAKQYVTLRFSHLGQELERRGQPYVGMVTFEKREGGLVHGHAPFFVLPENFDVVRRWADRFDETPQPRDESRASVPTHARFAVASDVLYALKQHRWAGSREAAREFYQKGATITGTRVAFTKAALAVIAKAEGKDKQSNEVRAPLVEAGASSVPPIATPYVAPVATAAAPIAIPAPVIEALPAPASLPIAATAQFDLFAVDALPALPKPKRRPVRAPVVAAAPHPVLPIEAELIDLAAHLEAVRIARGETQEHFADKHLGLSQGGYANWRRHHDKLGQWRINRVIEFIRLAA
jgi:hypothetical protein